MKLFDDLEQDDQGSNKNQESPFDFLNKSGPHNFIRSILESWFKGFPTRGQADLRARFRSNDQQNHEGAIFELFLHALFVRLGCLLEVHPGVRGTTTKPDFRVRHGEEYFYLEATSIGRQQSVFTPNNNEEDAIQKLETLTSPYFNVLFNSEGELSKTLGKNTVCRPFKKLLNDHQPEEVRRQIEQGGRLAAPSETIKHGSWRLQGWLAPISHQQGGISDEDRRIKTYHAIAKRTDAVHPIRKVLEEKSKKYGSLDGPIVVAVNAQDPFYNGKLNDLDMLFGDEQLIYDKENPDRSPQIERKKNGLWSRSRRHPIDVVARFQRIDVFNLLHASACLYFNPDKTSTVMSDVLLRLPHAKVGNGEIRWVEGENITRILGIRSN